MKYCVSETYCNVGILGSLIVTHGFLHRLFDPEDGGDVSAKRRLTFNGLHDVKSQEIVQFILTAERTSNPTHVYKNA
jgi:hypothetical protein